MTLLKDARQRAVATITLFFAIVGFFGAKSLFADNASEKNIPIQSGYVWFPVSGSETNCNAATPDLTLYLVDDYPDPEEDLPQTTDPSENCQGQIFCCAKGYSLAHLTTEIIGGQEYWVPASSTPDDFRMRN